MSGIVFFATEDPEPVIEFYVDRVGAERWLDQPDCTVLEYEGFRFAFCERDRTESCGILTFLADDRAGVDRLYERLEDRARDPPAVSDKYRIYRFFAEDPDGRTAEFQTFLDH